MNLRCCCGVFTDELSTTAVSKGTATGRRDCSGVDSTWEVLPLTMSKEIRVALLCQPDTLSVKAHANLSRRPAKPEKIDRNKEDKKKAADERPPMRENREYAGYQYDSRGLKCGGISKQRPRGRRRRSPPI